MKVARTSRFTTVRSHIGGWRSSGFMRPKTLRPPTAPGLDSGRNIVRYAPIAAVLIPVAMKLQRQSATWARMVISGTPATPAMFPPTTMNPRPFPRRSRGM